MDASSNRQYQVEFDRCTLHNLGQLKIGGILMDDHETLVRALSKNTGVGLRMLESLKLAKINGLSCFLVEWNSTIVLGKQEGEKHVEV